MKHVRIMLAAAGLFVASGTPGSVRAENAVTLYTSTLRATMFHCDAVNVSRKTLRIAISIIDLDGVLLSAAPFKQTLAGTEAFNDVDTSPDATLAYCKFQVLGTDDRNDVRVVLSTTLIRTFDQGGQTNIPVFVTRTTEGH
jgi:hypothetical protein